MLRNRLLFALLLFASVAPALRSQGQAPIVIKPRPEEEVILAVADAQPASPQKAAELSDAVKTFNRVLWDDLKFAGYFTLAGKSFYPPQPIVRVEDINYDAWMSLPFRVTFLTAGTLDIVDGVMVAELRIFDVKQRSMSFGQRISGEPSQVRAVAHRWADEIVYKLTAGQSRGIALTKIAYTSRRGSAKEIFVMDYDGFDQHAFTRNGASNLFPQWSADNSMITFASFRTGKWEINLHSFVDGSRLPFPLFNSFASTPAISPDGTRIVFALRTPRGDADLFVSKIDGSDRRNITNHPAIDSSPAWSPSGRQIAFISDREGGAGQLFICDADGASVRRVVKEGGDADSPAWSPDGRWIAFHWKPHLASGYDIFLADPSSARVSHQVTSNSGSNESPTWAPDSRHLAFQSSRSGSWQIYLSLADGSETRMITSQASNTSPAWGGYVRRE
jgi:TolB protein